MAIAFGPPHNFNDLAKLVFVVAKTMDFVVIDLVFSKEFFGNDLVVSFIVEKFTPEVAVFDFGVGIHFLTDFGEIGFGFVLNDDVGATAASGFNGE